jgi:hypothetical protein
MVERLLQTQLNRMFPTRDWADISGNWLNNIPTVTPPGSRPPSVIEEFIGFDQVARNLDSHNREQRLEIPAFRELVFHEALYLLHKASHVIGCSETDADTGAHTWSLSQAYQGAYFAAKSICQLLGGFLQEYKRHGIVVDIWPGISSANASRAGLLTDNTISLWYYKFGSGHLQMWQLFQHLLRTTKVTRWPTEYIAVMASLEPSDFAKQRNVIHYDGGRWIFDDLFEFTPNTSYGLISNKFVNGFVYDERSDFTFILAQAIFRMGLMLLDDLKAMTHKLEPEVAVFNKRINSSFHPYYSKEFPI